VTVKITLQMEKENYFIKMGKLNVKEISSIVN
jgi:hypothetical protein